MRENRKKGELMEENELVKLFWWADGEEQLLLKTTVETREDLRVNDGWTDVIEMEEMVLAK